MTLYGKDGAVSLIESMIKRDRLPHAFIFFGESGVGKKTLARYIAAQILCEEGTGVPCGKCLACRKIEKDIHPDFIRITPGGKNGNYLSDELRAIVSDAAVAPNESAKKLYFLPNIDRSLPEAQNMLLKVVGEPPSHVMFLMTAESREKILPTILSRVISIGVTEPSEEDCLKALSDLGKDPVLSKEAVKIFGGNIGRCIEYADNNGSVEYLEAVKSVIQAMINRDEFGLCAALTSLDGSKSGRGSVLEVLSALRSVMRDVCAYKLGTPLESVCRDGAQLLAGKIRQSGALKIYDAISAAEKKIIGNALVPLVMAELSASIAVCL